MTIVILVLFLFLNFGISWFNAWSVGSTWAETKMAGGLSHFMAWCGAIMSACGFTWVYVAVIGFALNHFHYLNDRWTEALFSAGYLVIILPVLGSGLAITIQSWAYFWREKNLMNGGVTAYNTFAQISNTYNAITMIPEALENVIGVFKGDGDEDEGAKGAMARYFFIALLFAIIGGVLTTRAILLNAARSSSAAKLDKLSPA